MVAPMRRIHPTYRVFVGALLLFAGLLTVVLLDRGPTGVDAVVLQALEDWRSPTLTEVVGHLTDLGGHHFMVPFCTVLVLVVTWRARRAGVFLGASLLGSALLNEGVKALVARPRPRIVEMLEHPRGLSFPSGHSQSTAALAAASVLLLWAVRPEWRGRALTFLALPLTVGWTRGYLGVHYPTDVIAGWSLATVWVIACWTWYRNRELGPFAEAGDEARESLGSSESAPAERGSADAAPPPG
jgi:membrane-associated phospholipid phosphatase